MDLTPELLAKLSRRLRSIEGETAVLAAQASRRKTAREQPPVTPLCHGGIFLRSVSADCSNDGATPSRSARSGEAGPLVQHGRVRIPSWIHDSVDQEASPVKPTAVQRCQRFLQAHASSQRQGSTERSPALPSPKQDLLRRLRRAERDRDDARESIEHARASHAARGEDLESEAVRLRQVVGALHDQLVEARRDLLARRQGASAGSGSSHGAAARAAAQDPEGSSHGAAARAAAQEPAAASGSSSQRAAALAETRQLAESLGRQARERRALEVRLGSLSSELEHQAASHLQLQEQLQVARGREEQLELRLKALCSRRAEANHDAGGGTDHPSWRSATAEARPGVPANAESGERPATSDTEADGRQAPVEPTAGSQESSDVGTESFECAEEADGLNAFDLETGKLEHALELLGGAGSADSKGPAIPRVEEPVDFSAPIAELQQVLKMLNHAEAPAEAEAEARDGISGLATVPAATPAALAPSPLGLHALGPAQD